MRRLAADKTMGRAEAMRQSMLALIDKGEFHEAHPAYWCAVRGGRGRRALVSDEKPLSALPLRTAQRHKRTQAFELFMLWTRSKGLFSILEQRSGWRRGWCLSP